MNGVRVGLLLLGSALILQACTTGGAPARHGESAADQLISGVMDGPAQSCARHLTMFCTGTGSVRLQCSCQDPDALARALSSLPGAQW